MKAATVGEGASDAETPIGGKQLKSLGRLQGELEKFFTNKVNVQHERLEGNDSLRGHIPEFALSKFELGFANLQQQRSHVDSAVETQTGDAKKISEEAKEATRTMKALTESIKVYIDEAEAHVASLATGA